MHAGLCSAPAHLALFGLIQSDFQRPKRADRLGPRGYLCPGPWARIWGLEVGLYQGSLPDQYGSVAGRSTDPPAILSLPQADTT